MTRYCTLLLSLFAVFSLHAQQKFTVSGSVSDVSTGEMMIGATIYEVASGKGVTSNVYGFYSLTLPAGEVELVFSYVGYQPQKFRITLDADMAQDVALNGTVELQEAEIVATEKMEQRTQMSTNTLDMKKVEQLPVLLGEKDLLKTLQLLPGVQSGSEGTSGIYVRGGGPDQNLLLLDGVPIYNASHLFGFFSVFNSDAIRNVELTKGGFPARYGGRLSSVLDIRMKEGNTKKLHGAGSIGLISSKLTLEGPIKNENTSFIVSGRRTYIDLLAQPFIRRASEGETRAGYYFWDFNGKINHKLDDRNRLFLSGYLGKDRAYGRNKYEYTNRDGERFVNREDFGLEWGNSIVAARWNHFVGPRMFSNVTLTYSNYLFETGIEIKEEGPDFEEENKIKYGSGIRDWGGKVEFDFIPTPEHYIKFGMSSTAHRFTPGVLAIELAAEGFEADTTLGSALVDAVESFIFIEDDWQINQQLKINPGIHISHLNVEGQNYLNFEPRLGARYLISEKWSAKASYAQMNQYLHLLSNVGIGLPTDLWVPVTKQIKPQRSHQVALGLATTVDNTYEISLEGYYKALSNLIEYRDGAGFTGTAQDWQSKVIVGEGEAYGAELLLSKTKGDLSGWIGYTLAWSNRTFEEANFGETFPYRYDRRHDVSVALSYQINERIDIGAVWVYGTGNAVSLPLARYEGGSTLPSLSGDGISFNSSNVEYFPERNNYRMPAYHRLDFGVNFTKEMKRHTRVWNISVYNMYNRQNPFFLFFQTNVEGDRRLFQQSLFPLIPSVSYAFKF